MIFTEAGVSSQSRKFRVTIKNHLELEAQPSRIVMEEYEIVEGENGQEERVVATIDLGTFGEVTGRSEGTDDDDARNDTELGS